MVETCEFGKDYLLLVLRLGKHVEGYVDSYFGPPEYATIVEQEKKKSPKILYDDVKRLIHLLSDQGFDDERNKYFDKQLAAMITLIDILSGVEVAYLEKVRLLFDIRLKPEIDESHISRVMAEFDELYHGQGSILERVEKVRQENTILSANVERIIRTGLAIVKKETKKLYDPILPPNEALNIKIVVNEPWLAYNWYLGNYQSRIDVNADLPIEWDAVLGLMSHEGYPGHHTELSIKERLLYHKKNHFEHAVALLHSPTAVISEGLAMTGLDVIFPDETRRMEIILAELCPNTPDTSVDILLRQQVLGEEIKNIFGHLAIQANVDDWTDDEMIKQVQEFNLPYTEERIRMQLKFIKHPIYAPYYPTYFYGRKLISQKYGEKPSPEDFAQLLTKTILPSDLE